MGFFSKEEVTIKEIAESLVKFNDNILFIDSLKKTNSNLLIGKEEYKELLVFSIIPIMMIIFSVFKSIEKAQSIFDRFYSNMIYKNLKNKEDQDQFNIFFEERKNEYIKIYNSEKGEDKFYPLAKFFCEKFFKKEQDYKNAINILLAHTILSNRLITTKEFLDGVLKKFTIIN